MQSLLPDFKNMLGLMQKVQQTDGQDFLGLVLQYIVDRAEISDHEAFIRIIEQQISPALGEEVMSLAAQWRREGRQEGRQEGEQLGREKNQEDIAKKLLQAGSDLNFVVRVTGLSLNKLRTLQ